MAQDPTRSTPRKAAEAEVKDQKPKAPKPRTGSTAARLAPEIERLSAELAAATPVRWGASTMVVGASAGVAVIGPLDTPADVLTRADAAMYARKMKRKESHSPPHAAHAS
jgi:GGDEF domain-containing protein